MGGLGEMGRHHLAVDLPGGSVFIDAGARFPDEPTLGIERTTSPTEPILRRAAAGRLCGLLLTHGHQDHIGGLLEVVRACPTVRIFGHPFVVDLVRRRWAYDGDGLTPPHLHPVEPGHWVDLGGVEARWYSVTHSIPAAASVAVRSGGRVVVHSGDFRVDPTPLLGAPTDWTGLRELGAAGVEVALVDSTQAGRPGRTRSEAVVAQALRERIAGAPGRVFITLFASHVERLHAIQSAAAALGRPFFVYGGGLQATWELATKHGLAPSLPSMDPVPDHGRLPERAVVAMSGSQLEPFSPMWRLARQEDPKIRLGPGDTVLWSARVVPGGERAVSAGINAILEQGAAVDPPWAEGAALHTSGHGHQVEIDEWVEAVAPTWVVPVHGEVFHLERHRAAWMEKRPTARLRSGAALVFPAPGSGSPPRYEKVPATEAGMPIHSAGRQRFPEGDAGLRARARLGHAGFAWAVVQRGARGEVTARVESIGVFPEALREEEEQLASQLLGAALRPTRGPATEPLELRANRSLARILRDRTGQRVPCRATVPTVVERA